jgi:drug/metabolite transporter (DMT)-like permease
MKKKNAVFALLFSVFCSSTVPLFLKYFTPYLDAWTVNGFRYITVFIIMLPLVIKFIRSGKYSAYMWKIALIPAAFNFFQQILWAWAPYFIDPGLIGFLIKSTVIWSISGSFILFADERYLMRSKMFWSGLFIAVAGFVGLSYYGNNISLSGTFLGVLFVLGSSILMSLYGLAVKKYFNETNAIVSFSLIALYTAVGIISLMFVFGNPMQALNVPLNIMLIIALSAFIGINMAHILFYVSLKHLGVTISYSVSFFSAFFTAILSFYIFDEKLSLFQWISGSLIIAGGMITILSKKNRKASQ